jgi:preprotein translocase subunit SecG
MNIYSFFSINNNSLLSLIVVIMVQNPKVVVYLYLEVPHNGWQQKQPIFLDKATWTLATVLIVYINVKHQLTGDLKG